MYFKKLTKTLLSGVMAVALMVSGCFCCGSFESKAASYASETAGRRVVGYLPSYRTYAVDSIDFSALTHCNLSFMTYSNGTVTSGFSAADVTKIVDKCHSNNVKAIIAIGGWNGFINDGAFTTASKRSSIVNQIMNYVDTYNLDGVDIDIELADADIWNNYDAFISELSGRLKAEGKILTMAVSPWFTGSIANSTYNYFDFLNLMTYDYDQHGGDVAPWSQIYDNISYYSSRGVSNDRMVIGVPFYGYNSAGTAYTYAELINMNPSAANYDYYNGISYNGAATIRAKAEYSKSYGGIMMWELGQDSFGSNSLLGIIKEVMAAGAPSDSGNSQGSNSGSNNNQSTNTGSTTSPSTGMGITYINASSAQAYVNNSSWVDIHYSVNGGAQQNIRMTQNGTTATYTINGLSNGSIVSYWFTYSDTRGYTQDTAMYSYTHAQTSSGNTDNGNTNSGNNTANTNSGDIYIYQDINYGGNVASLGLGDYRLSDLQAKGFKNDDLSSLKVPFGYKVTLYADDNFQGATKVITSDTSWIGSDFNDKTSSIKVVKAQYRIVSRYSGLAIDIAGANTASGTNVQQWTTNGTVAQGFEVSGNSDGTYVITSIMHGKALDMGGWSTENGGNLIIWDNNNTDNQRWYINDVGDGYVNIINKFSGKCLDVEGWSNQAGGNIHQWDYFGQSNQQWRFEVIN